MLLPCKCKFTIDPSIHPNSVTITNDIDVRGNGVYVVLKWEDGLESTHALSTLRELWLEGILEPVV